MPANERVTDEAAATVGTEPTTAAGSDDELIVEQSLIEEVSIDGMCGVY